MTREIIAEDDETIEFTFEDPDGNPLDITGTSITWALAPAPTEAAVLSKSTSGGGITKPNAGGGRADVQIDSADTDGLGGAVYYHEVELEDAGGDKTTVVPERLFIRPALIQP